MNQHSNGISALAGVGLPVEPSHWPPFVSLISSSKSILFEVSVFVPAFSYFCLHGTSFSVFMLFICLSVYVSCRQHIDVSLFLKHSASLYILIVEFHTLVASVIHG